MMAMLPTLLLLLLYLLLNALLLSDAVLHAFLQWSTFATKRFSNILLAFPSCFQLALQCIYPCSFHLVSLPVHRFIFTALHSPFTWHPFLPSSFQYLISPSFSSFCLFMAQAWVGPGVGGPALHSHLNLGSGGVGGGDWRTVLGWVLLLANHLIASTVQLLLTATVKSRPSMIVLLLCVRPVKQLPWESVVQ